jgi:alcohol dehydrogenase YqhD (iron-dependent ADH family)
VKAVAIVKEQNIDFILAVGGGSVIDGVNLFRELLIIVVTQWIFTKTNFD